MNVEPLTPVDIPPFLAGLLAAQAGKHAPQRCTCAAEHGGSGRYVFLGLSIVLVGNQIAGSTKNILPADYALAVDDELAMCEARRTARSGAV